MKTRTRSGLVILLFVGLGCHNESVAPKDCPAFNLSWVSPADAATVTGSWATRPDGSKGLTIPFTLTACMPKDQSAGTVEIMASTTNGAIIRKVGAAAGVPGGDYGLAAGLGPAGNVGQWLPPSLTEAGPLDPNTYKFWGQIRQTNGTIALKTTPITLTLAGPK